MAVLYKVSVDVAVWRWTAAANPAHAFSGVGRGCVVGGWSGVCGRVLVGGWLVVWSGVGRGCVEAGLTPDSTSHADKFGCLGSVCTAKAL